MSAKMSVKNDWQRACDGVLSILTTKRCSKNTLSRYYYVYKKLLSFLTQRKLIDKPVNKKTTDAFVRSFNNVSRHARTQRLYTCAIRRLLEFHQRGTFDHKQKEASPVLLPSTYESILKAYREYRIVEVASVSKAAEKQHLNDIRDFLRLLHVRRISSIRRIRFDDVQAYLGSNSNHSSSRISHRACAMRSFFRFLIVTKGASPALLGFVPRVRHTGVFRLAAIWPQADIKKLLSVVNRKTDLGKRDYAIILLISSLGLRIGDVRDLKIENIDWRKAVIHITRQKTKNIQTLPMSEEVGKALIDYLKNGRPSVSSRHIFVMHQPPYEEFPETSGLQTILTKYRKKADILLPEESRKGWHSLRHSLATRLLEEDTPLPVIATILGHDSVETTRLYTRTNIKMLRSASLEWEEF